MVRQAISADFSAVAAIYNQAILTGGQTAFTELFTDSAGAAFFAEYLKPGYPMFVYEADGSILGWATISPYRKGRAALKRSVEISYFVHEQHGGKGIGSALLHHVLDACFELGYHTVLAIILEGNDPSVKLVEKFGFTRWGYLPGVAEFDGKLYAHLYYGKSL